MARGNVPRAIASSQALMCGYRFREGVSACIVSGRVILLDIDADRFFGLAAPLDATLRKAAQRGALTVGDVANLDALSRRDILIRTGGGAFPSVCSPLDTAVSSLLEIRQSPVRLTGRIGAAAAILRTRASLRVFGLAYAVGQLRRSGRQDVRNRPSELYTIAQEFAGAVAWVGALNQCLAHSFAVAHRLGQAGLDHCFVMGISVRPFRAHAWVQSGDVVINDHVDLVRRFTPILVI